jgi:hypothetical protein
MAAAGSTLSNFWPSSNRREAMTFLSLSTILADNPISAVGSEPTAIRKRLTSIRSWKSCLSGIRRAQRRVSDIVILEALDQSGLQ